MENIIYFLIAALNIYVIFLVVLLVLDNRDTSSTLAWLLVFIFVPVLGPVLYLLLGRNWRGSPIRSKLTKPLLEINSLESLVPLAKNQKKKAELLSKKGLPPYSFKLFHLLFKNSGALLVRNNRIKILQNGAEKFPLLIHDLKKARHFIHMEYFIWRDDKLTQRVKRILIKKAQAGVEVRILLDYLGCIWLDKKYINELRGAGIEVYFYFNFISIFRLHTLNYRNHRKVVVIDGVKGYIGGMNMGQEYIDGGGHFPAWRDTHLKIEGQAVKILQSVFAVSWYNTTKEKLIQEKYYPEVAKEENPVPLQLPTSGPDSRWESIEQMYFAMISAATEKVYIQSPYFVPSASVQAALKTAALSGMDVRIMVTGVPDKKIPYWSAFTYFKELLIAGARIYHYKKGFLHSKTVVLDSQICSVGTANMDVRSFRLDYEINALIYDAKEAGELEADFRRDLEDCKEFTLSDYRRLSFLKKLRNSFVRLLAPLL